MPNTHPQILVAEDDPVLREAYLRKFTREGYSVRLAENGEEAVRLIREQTPDLLICDIMMPIADGWFVLERFPKGKRPFPVILLTNLEDDDSRSRAETLADGYFVKKDMELAALVDMIASLLKTHSHS